MAVYLRKVSDSIVHVWSPAKYNGTAPGMPLWRIDSFMSGDSGLAGGMDSGEWTWNGFGCGHLIENNKITNIYDGSDWDASNLTGGVDTTNTIGTDDGQQAGVPLNEFYRSQVTEAIGIDVSIAVVAGQGDSIEVAMQGSRIKNLAITVTKDAVPVSLNGRGISIIPTTDFLKNNCLRPIWNGSGQLENAITAAGTAVPVEILRNVDAGTYVITMTATASTLIYFGRVRCIQPTSFSVDKTKMFPYFAEYDSNPVALGCNINASLIAVASVGDGINNDDATEPQDAFIGGPAHGKVTQTDLAWTADESPLTLTTNGWYGPYDSLSLAIDQTYEIQNTATQGVYEDRLAVVLTHAWGDGINGMRTTASGTAVNTSAWTAPATVFRFYVAMLAPWPSGQGAPYYLSANDFLYTHQRMAIVPDLAPFDIFASETSKVGYRSTRRKFYFDNLDSQFGGTAPRNIGRELWIDAPFSNHVGGNAATNAEGVWWAGTDSTHGKTYLTHSLDVAVVDDDILSASWESYIVEAGYADESDGSAPSRRGRSRMRTERMGFLADYYKLS